jgi:hypothetical protein
MSTLVRSTGRSFAVVRYIAAHSQLLFRSSRGEGGPGRVDIAFTAVQYLNLHTLRYDDFTIYELTEEEFRSVAGPLGDRPPAGCRRYGVGGAEMAGVLIASSFLEHADDGEDWEPSAILKFDP